MKKPSILFKAKIEVRYRVQQGQHTMSAKAEIEAQIRALQGKLKECIEIDPEFTPAELVRWRPSLIGTMLHAKRQSDLPDPAASPSEKTYPPQCHVHEQFGLLVPGGMLVSRDETDDEIRYAPGRPPPEWLLPTKEKLLYEFQEMIKVKVRNRDVGLCKPDEILDRIFAASSHTLPRPVNTLPTVYGGPAAIHCVNTASCDASFRYPSSMLIVIDHYPLSVLYKEWLADKHRRPPVIHPESGAAATTATTATTAIPSPYVLAADIKASRYAKAE